MNVPPGVPVFKLDEVKAAAEKMASPDGEVRAKLLHTILSGEAWVSCVCVVINK